MKKTKIKLSRNAIAMQSVGVPIDRPSLWVFRAFTAFAAGMVSWLLISTAGAGITLCILAIHIIPIILCRLMAPHPRLSFNPFKGEALLKPVSAGGRRVTRVEAPATTQKGTSLLRNTN